MKQYKSVRIVGAQPCSYGKYMDMFDRELEEGEAELPGFIVELPVGSLDGEEHPKHKCNIKWVAAHAFEYEYDAMESTLSFGDAVEFLRIGKKAARTGWNGKGMFIFLVPGSVFEVNRKPLLGIYPAGTKIDYQPHIDMRTADGTIVPWLASQSDVLAKDWVLVN